MRQEGATLRETDLASDHGRCGDQDRPSGNIRSVVSQQLSVCHGYLENGSTRCSFLLPLTAPLGFWLQLLEHITQVSHLVETRMFTVSPLLQVGYLLKCKSTARKDFHVLYFVRKVLSQADIFGHFHFLLHAQKSLTIIMHAEGCSTDWVSISP